jgi:hypothetical protein
MVQQLKRALRGSWRGFIPSIKSLVMQHDIQSRQVLYAIHSSSSLSLAEHALSSSIRIEELANCRLLRVTPIPVGRHRRHRKPRIDESRRTNHHVPTTPRLFVYFSRGPMSADKPNLCSFTSYYITNFEYTLTLSFSTSAKTAGTPLCPAVPIPHSSTLGPPL